MKKFLFVIPVLAVCACGGSEKPMDTAKDQMVHTLFTHVEKGEILYGHQDDLAYGHA